MLLLPCIPSLVHGLLPMLLLLPSGSRPVQRLAGQAANGPDDSLPFVLDDDAVALAFQQPLQQQAAVPEEMLQASPAALALHRPSYGHKSPANAAAGSQLYKCDMPVLCPAVLSCGLLCCAVLSCAVLSCAAPALLGPPYEDKLPKSCCQFQLFYTWYGMAARCSAVPCSRMIVHSASGQNRVHMGHPSY